MHIYVLATKWPDGDPCDHFVVGFLEDVINVGSSIRYIIVDWKGDPFRANGFRRVEAITKTEGKALLEIFPLIGDKPGPSLWEHLQALRGRMTSA